MPLPVLVIDGDAAVGQGRECGGVERLGNASILVVVTGRAGDEVRLKARLTLVFASLETRRAVRIPDDLRAAMSRDLVA